MIEEAAICSMVEEDRVRFRVGGGRLHFRRAQENVGYEYLRADGDIAVLHCCDGQEAPTHMTCVVLSRHQADETPVYVGQCVSCGTVWLADALIEAPPHNGAGRGWGRGQKAGAGLRPAPAFVFAEVF